ncbi:similar to Saccharomyces cerevisiae YDR200C VPS64 Protein required for cytoplasm to vacuole targeting of proteins [Maudiozyma barnettii]|uniref:Similar to Saccharomyces cerevisiae YDR200C VPS64 Protein required for cytoplasm to vacuole targeting of proteins n=1 Tax=Maudiozyma barnettii TaxID=61262 RepID=A0A8H2ZHZ5_9SACH|nr:Vps64p [Kazachstania barnettii]CAB4255002.1 similar to Saccharomyces cerevisiae YDR200C VPS64 Protein required for cytoplasm to vacuole targeting of proteins [Kazachstania barnettii]CAD1783273.1 similar to Saccharomyces cerevisiae YDR200C VPS64 Protein required for cytoplasm to vacuole targeting of proteins [Kazachstania barnettii]
MAEVDKGKRLQSHASPKMKQNSRMSTGRARSNSRSSGSRSQPSFDQFDLAINPMTMKPVNANSPNTKIGGSVIPILPTSPPGPDMMQSTINAPLERQVVPPPTFTSRNRYTHILILRSLNGTFETKYLVIPFKPDALKLGRPVVSSNSSGNGNGGSGPNGNNCGSNSKRDASSMVKSDNGNFDSRVLSRNHASLSCDSKTGKIYIKDLKSSNGTFVNGNRIDQEYVELKVGDVIDLGTDIDTKFEHRKISAFVEEISVIPLIDGITELPNTFSETGNNKTDLSSSMPLGVAKTIQGHAQLQSQSFSKQQQSQPTTTAINSNRYNLHRGNDDPYLAVTASTAQRAAFEAAMFGDVNNLDIEDAVLGPETEILSGIFINNSIGTSPNLINIIKSLATEIALEKQEFLKLKSIENFLVNYTTNLEYVNKLMMEMNDKQLVKLQNSLKQQFTEKHETLIKDTKAQIEKTKNDANEFKDICNEKGKNDNATIQGLEMQVDDLKTRLEVEKYKNTKLQASNTTQKKVSKINIADSTALAEEGIDDDKPSKIDKNRQYLDEHKANAGKSLKGATLLTITAVSVGFIALILKYSYK